jgi:hypothetical protein
VATACNSPVEPFKLKSVHAKICKMDQHGLDDHDKIISGLPRSLELAVEAEAHEDSTARLQRKCPEIAASPVKAT